MRHPLVGHRRYKVSLTTPWYFGHPKCSMKWPTSRAWRLWRHADAASGRCGVSPHGRGAWRPWLHVGEGIPPPVVQRSNSLRTACRVWQRLSQRLDQPFLLLVHCVPCVVGLRPAWRASAAVAADGVPRSFLVDSSTTIAPDSFQRAAWFTCTGPRPSGASRRGCSFLVAHPTAHPVFEILRASTIDRLALLRIG